MTILSHRKSELAVAALSLTVLASLAVPAVPPLSAASLPIADDVQEKPSEPTETEESTIQVGLGVLTENIACLNDPTQTYTLYLPSGYKTERRWPVLFIFDPRGRSAMAAEIFRSAAERYGWILMSSDNTRSDGPWDPNTKAVAAMGPDVSRYAYDSNRAYATGFSGGAVLAWIWGQETQALAGVISSGGRPVRPSETETAVPFAHFGAAGDEEFNYLPTRELDDTAARLGAPHRFESFPGRHAWMPAELALEAVEWMEIQAMRSGTRETDPDLVAELFEKDLERARELESAGNLLKAQRRYDAIARTFAGLLDVKETAGRAAMLAKSAEVKKALSVENSAERYQRSQQKQIGRVLGRFTATTDGADQATIMSVGQLEVDLRLQALLETAKEDTAKGFAARRALGSLSVQLGFYLPREFFRVQDYERAAVVLELATRIGPPRPFVLYDLACARARSGSRKSALSALAYAVDAGFSNLEHMEQDPDLERLRKLPAYKDLVARMRDGG